MKLSKKQIQELKTVKIPTLSTYGKGYPHCVAVATSRIEEEKIIIPVVQMQTSIKNIKENNKIFLHFIKEDPDDYENISQYKIEGIAEYQDKGKLFEEVKQHEESEVLPEGFFVNAILVITIVSVEECVG